MPNKKVYFGYKVEDYGDLCAVFQRNGETTYAPCGDDVWNEKDLAAQIERLERRGMDATMFRDALADVRKGITPN